MSETMSTVAIPATYTALIEGRTARDDLPSLRTALTDVLLLARGRYHDAKHGTYDCEGLRLLDAAITFVGFHEPTGSSKGQEVVQQQRQTLLNMRPMMSALERTSTMADGASAATTPTMATMAGVSCPSLLELDSTSTSASVSPMKSPARGGLAMAGRLADLLGGAPTLGNAPTLGDAPTVGNAVLPACGSTAAIAPTMTAPSMAPPAPDFSEAVPKAPAEGASTQPSPVEEEQQAQSVAMAEPVAEGVTAPAALVAAASDETNWNTPKVDEAISALVQRAIRNVIDELERGPPVATPVISDVPADDAAPLQPEGDGLNAQQAASEVGVKADLGTSLCAVKGRETEAVAAVQELVAAAMKAVVDAHERGPAVPVATAVESFFQADSATAPLPEGNGLQTHEDALDADPAGALAPVRALVAAAIKAVVEAHHGSGAGAVAVQDTALRTPVPADGGRSEEAAVLLIGAPQAAVVGREPGTVNIHPKVRELVQRALNTVINANGASKAAASDSIPAAEGTGALPTAAGQQAEQEVLEDGAPGLVTAQSSADVAANELMHGEPDRQTDPLTAVHVQRLVAAAIKRVIDAHDVCLARVLPAPAVAGHVEPVAEEQPEVANNTSQPGVRVANTGFQESRSWVDLFKNPREPVQVVGDDGENESPSPLHVPLPVAKDRPAQQAQVSDPIRDADEGGGPWTLVVRKRRGRQAVNTSQPAAVSFQGGESAAATARRLVLATSWVKGAVRANRFALLQDITLEDDESLAEAESDDPGGQWTVVRRLRGRTMAKAVAQVAATTPAPPAEGAPVSYAAVAGAGGQTASAGKPQAEQAHSLQWQHARHTTTTLSAMHAVKPQASPACASGVGTDLAASVEWALAGAVVRQNRFAALAALGDA
eukprot:jgi/Ulvmu1/12290/UM088_0005.1